MALLDSDRITQHERWPELEQAAGERYLDGLSLAADLDGRNTGAIYLLGYVAEILLKAAYYRVREVNPLQDLRRELQGIPNRARALGLRWRGNWHNLDNLATLLVAERRSRGRQMNPMLAATLHGHVQVISLNWQETLRYKHVRATENEVTSVFRSIDWLYGNYSLFWS